MTRRWWGSCDGDAVTLGARHSSGAIFYGRDTRRATGVARPQQMSTFPTQARVVVIGGGIMGCSTAYHLAKLRWKDRVLLEQGRLSGGTTWHAPGLVGQLRSYQNLTRLIRYSPELYSQLEAETRPATGWNASGP